MPQTFCNLNIPDNQLLQVLRVYLNQKIDLIQSQGSIVGIDRIIIMAALNITNELLNQNSSDGLDISQFRHKISSIEHQIDEVLAQN